MNRLTDEEIKKYIKEKNRETGVDGITEERLRSIDLDNVPEVIDQGLYIKDKNDKIIYKYDSFTPKAGSIYLKPSFAGDQVLMGRVGRELLFSNGRWFSTT